MHYLNSSMFFCFTSLLTCLSAALAKDHGESYQVHRHAVGSGPKDGLMVLEKAYRRRNWVTPEGLRAALTFREDAVSNSVHSSIKEDFVVRRDGSGYGKVTAKAYGTNTEYLCPVKIGDRTYNMDLDTGSADLWIFNTALPAAVRNGHHAIYNQSESRSFQSIPGAWFDVSYGDNSSTSGLVGKETVCIGTITVVDQAIERTYFRN